MPESIRSIPTIESLPAQTKDELFSEQQLGENPEDMHEDLL